MIEETRAVLALVIEQWMAFYTHSDRIAELGLRLDAAEIRALARMRDHGRAMRPSDLAHLLSTGPSNISKILRRLESRDLIERLGDPSDHRISWIRLTPDGRRQADQLVDIFDRTIAQWFAQWTSEEIGDLHRAVHHLAASMLHYDPHAFPDPPQWDLPR